MRRLWIFARKLSSVEHNESVRITVRPNVYIYLVLLLFLIPIQWLFAWILALSVHEFCHWAAVKACGGKVFELTIGIGGVQMQSTPLPNRRRLFCILSGPLGGFLLVFLGRWFSRIALCSWILSLYNLLPFSFLDGGKGLEILIGNNITEIIGKILLILLSVAAVYAAFVFDLGILPLAVITGLWLKNRNTPCKPHICRLQ